MPVPKTTGVNQGRTLTRFGQRHVSPSSPGSATPGAPSSRAVDVTTSDWTADSSGYVGAPNSTIGPGGNGEAQRATVAHNLATEDVVVTGFRDAAGRVWPASVFVDQMLNPSNTTNEIQIWLAEIPSGTITVYVDSYRR